MTVIHCAEKTIVSDSITRAYKRFSDKKLARPHPFSLRLLRVFHFGYKHVLFKKLTQGFYISLTVILAASTHMKAQAQGGIFHSALPENIALSDSVDGAIVSAEMIEGGASMIVHIKAWEAKPIVVELADDQQRPVKQLFKGKIICTGWEQSTDLSTLNDSWQYVHCSVGDHHTWVQIRSRIHETDEP